MTHPFPIQFTVAKVTERKYADCLLDGQVYARPLSNFSMSVSRGAVVDSTVANDFRGDRLEGAVSVMKLGGGSIVILDRGDSQYIKNYSLVSLEYDRIRKKWSHADKRVTQFGDTAVVIRDLHTFMDRVIHALVDLYGEECLLLADRVSYYSVSDTKNLSCMFSKQSSYAWQNEFRLLFCKSKDFEGGAYQRIVLETDPVLLEIGDIRDIAYAIPVGYLTYGKWWEGYSFKFAMGPYGDTTKLENLVLTTRQLIGEYDATPGSIAVFSPIGSVP